jgi:hypothetical protein
MNLSKALLSLFVLLVVGITSFYGGTKYEQNKASEQAAPVVDRAKITSVKPGSRLTNIYGKVTAISGDSITVESDADKSLVKFTFSKSTQIMKESAGSASDIALGLRISAVGLKEEGGTLQADIIQLVK